MENVDKISLEGLKDGIDNSIYTFVIEQVLGIGSLTASIRKGVVLRQRCKALSDKKLVKGKLL